MNAKVELSRAIEIIKELVAMNCTVKGKLDSMASSAFADAIRFLDDHGEAEIETAVGHRIIAKWKQK